MAFEFSVHVPVLPTQLLSANKIAEGMTSKRARGAINAERQELRSATVQMVQSLYAPSDIPVAPKGTPIYITATLVHTFKRPGDGLYRPKDPSNIGGHIVKGPIDALVDLGIIDDDAAVCAGGPVQYVILAIDKCRYLRDEGLRLRVDLAGAEQDA